MTLSTNNDVLLINAPFWLEKLASISHPSAARMADDLDANRPLGIGDADNPFWKGFKHSDGKKESNIDFLICVKKQHPEKIVIVQIGEFYETWGIDSVFLVEYCGLNRMGRRGVRAGTPLANIQKVLNDLTSVGFSVVICEQAEDLTKSGRKTRFIAEIVTPSSPIYTHGLAMDKARSDLLFPESPPEFGIVMDKRGITVVEINPDLRTVLTMEGLTKEAALARLSRYAGRFGHVFCHENVDQQFIIDGHLQHEHLIRIDVYLPKDFARRMEELIKIDLNLSADCSFTHVYPIHHNHELTPAPLYLSSAQQMGILRERGVPKLIEYMLPKGSPVTCSNLLKSFLLNPPPKSVAEDIRQALTTLTTIALAIPEFPVANPARYVKTLQKHEASPDILKDLFKVAESFLACYSSAETWSLTHILRVVAHNLNFGIDVKKLGYVSQLILDTLTTVLPEGDDHVYVPKHDLISKHLFEYIEYDFRGHVAKTSSEEIFECYQRVKRAALRYEKVLTEELIPLIEQREVTRKDNKKIKPWALSFDIHNKAIWMRGPLTQKEANIYNLHHPVDRYGKTVKDRWTSIRAEKYLQEYKLAAEQARLSIASLLTDISKKLAPHSLSIAHLATFSNLMRMLMLHSKACRPKGWSLAVNYDDSLPLHLEGFFPYWMGKHTAVKNSLKLDGMAVLTGHNMAGKSTTIRSAAVVTLLASSGFMFPAKRISFSKPIDGWYLRTGSYDDPAAGLSTFAVEMNDINIALRDASKNTLVLIDELGKGTETRSGHAIAGSILEHLQAKNVSGIFSTHWHELFVNPAVQLDAMQLIYMATDNNKPSYKIAAGRCLSSAAYQTASELGISEKIIARAQEIEAAYIATAYTSEYKTVTGKKDFRQDAIAEVNEPVEKYQIYSLSAARHLMSDITGEPLETVKTIAAKTYAPAVDSQFSTLYILRTSLGFYYVGETDNINARIEAHRKVELKKDCEFIYVAIPLGKSAARRLESTLIKALVGKGFPMLSVDDAKHQHFGSS
ncbi:MutS-related protein [Agarilytica rhodophyticola]|uniref:MutS-related protein n=1 Tax=Agarilytica rhodophyticola TaxID=1737490 RepID=UPI000B342BF3|nr:hypothetical protein [Agarilytica rhodophyticola]